MAVRSSAVPAAEKRRSPDVPRTRREELSKSGRLCRPWQYSLDPAGGHCGDLPCLINDIPYINIKGQCEKNNMHERAYMCRIIGIL